MIKGRGSPWPNYTRHRQVRAVSTHTSNFQIICYALLDNPTLFITMDIHPQKFIATGKGNVSDWEGQSPGEKVHLETLAAIAAISQSHIRTELLYVETSQANTTSAREPQTRTDAHLLPSPNGTNWLTPHVHENQKHNWHYGSLGIGNKHVHDEYGFSSANVSRSHSRCCEGKENKVT
ncbi:hypothetical protein BDU57DRAFT_513881 [Ampelomyces quisqualis]|uniref:Uncharacterized protein n=1 Tax=Ampelomyces quisqualis TaxID=50730 RepID=A0A6A5QPB5_AMPQU|nr:hypothetical protein BDU57DRAFT_513881 [Ampelomyces quisqualis]